MCYLATFLCNDISGCPVPSVLHPSSLNLESLKQDVGWPGVTGLASLEATAWLLAYYLLSLALQVVLPAQEVEGVELSTGGKLKYQFNGMLMLRTHDTSEIPLLLT